MREGYILNYGTLQANSSSLAGLVHVDVSEFSILRLFS